MNERSWGVFEQWAAPLRASNCRLRSRFAPANTPEGVDRNPGAAEIQVADTSASALAARESSAPNRNWETPSGN
jgi:hypothetical protein